MYLYWASRRGEVDSELLYGMARSRKTRNAALRDLQAAQAITSGKGAIQSKSRKTETERKEREEYVIKDKSVTENEKDDLTVRFSGNERKGSRNHRVTTEWFQTSGSKMANALRRVQDSGRNFRATRHP